MYDALAILQAAVTKVATFNGPAFNLPGGTPLGGLVASVPYSAAANASGSNTVIFSIDHGDTSGGTFYPLAQGDSDTITLTTVAQANEILIPFRTNKPYVRLTCTIAGSGSTPTIAYSGRIGLTKP